MSMTLFTCACDMSPRDVVMMSFNFTELSLQLEWCCGDEEMSVTLPPHPVVVPPMRADPHTLHSYRGGMEGKGRAGEGNGREGTSATQRRLLNNPPVWLACCWSAEC